MNKNQETLRLIKRQEELLKQKKEKGLKDLFFFNKYIVETSQERRNYLVPHVHKEWSTWFDTSEKRILCILVPRSTFKSSFFTVGWILQLLAQNQGNRILIANATASNAEKFLGDIKNHIQKNEIFRLLYGNLYDKNLKWTDQEIEIVGRPLSVREPNVTTTGVGGNLVSQHYDFIVADDLVNLENSATRLQSNKVIDWWKRSLSLLEPSGKMLVVGTRWSYYELYSWLQEELKEEVDFYIRGAHLPDGSLYFPERLDEKKLVELKKLHGSYIYSAFYLNNPIDPDTAMVKPSQLKYFSESKGSKDVVMPENVIIFIAIDPAVSEGVLNDNTGFVAVAVDARDNWYILVARREKISVGEMINLTFALNDEYSPDSISLEVIGQGQALLSSFRAEEEIRKEYLPIVEIKGLPRVQKEMRISSILQPRFERGKIYIKRDQEDLIDELLHFPKSKYDDLIDALSQIQNIAYSPGEKKEKREKKYASKLVARLKGERDEEIIDEFLGENF